MTNLEILKRLFKDYTIKYLNKIILAVFFSILVAGSTSATAWLLDPAIKKIFIDQDKTMMLLIPGAIVLAFVIKGLSLYFSRTILINVSQQICKKLAVEMSSSILKSDTHTLESKHSGKYVSHFLYDVGLVANLVGTGVLNLMKDSLTLIVLVSLMFFTTFNDLKDLGLF